ncbi:hypothetical protein [Erwinia phage FBB1]|nr:hypothetical protein [Erwinia phage FBB1]
MKIERREVKYHITLPDGCHVDLLMKHYVGIKDMIVVITHGNGNILSVEKSELYTDSAYMIPLLIDIMQNSNDAWSIFDLIQISI